MTEEGRLSAVEAVAAVMADVTTVGKSQRHEQGYAYRGLDEIVNAVGPALRRHGLVVVPLVESNEFGTLEIGQGERRRAIAHCRVTVTYRWYGPAGDYIECRVAGEAFDAGDKATSKALAVAWRTALVQTLALATADDTADPPTGGAAGPGEADSGEPNDRRVVPSPAPPGPHRPAQGAGVQPASAAQLTVIHTLFDRCGWPDRNDKLRAAAALAGRELGSSKELTKAEAIALINRLQVLAAGDDPAGALTDLITEHEP